MVEFCALYAMTEHGDWVLAVSFTPFLSAVIHYMLLWLLCHCFSRPLPAAHEPGNDCALDSLIREEYDRLPCQHQPGAVADLSYW